MDNLNPKNPKNPEIRFKGFTEPWVERKLGELGAIHTGNTPSTEHKEYYTQGGVPWVTPTDIDGTPNISTEKTLSSEGLKVARTVPSGSVLCTCIASIGKNAITHTVCGFNQQINSLTPSKDYDSYFLFSESALWSDKMKEISAAGTMQIINKSEFSKITTYVPCSDEQILIGNYFERIDRLIVLQQDKLEKLKLFKKSMLEKMFPKEGSLVPEIRFKGFTEPWVERKLGNIFHPLRSNTLSRSDLSYKKGTVHNVHYGDILVKYGSRIDISNVEMPRIANEEIADRYISDSMCEGDIIFADTAEDETAGKCIELRKLDKMTVVSGLHTIPFRPKKDFADGYLGYYLNSSSFHNQLLSLMQGSKVTSISKSSILDTDIVFPCVEEQVIVGRFFINLDNLIAFQQDKLEKLKLFKKSMLDKMFV